MSNIWMSHVTHSNEPCNTDTNHTHTHIRTFTFISSGMFDFTAHLGAYAHTCMQACMHARMHVYTQASTHACMHACKHARIHTHIHTHTHSQSHTHTNTHHVTHNNESCDMNRIVSHIWMDACNIYIYISSGATEEVNNLFVKLTKDPDLKKYCDDTLKVKFEQFDADGSNDLDRYVYVYVYLCICIYIYIYIYMCI